MDSAVELDEVSLGRQGPPRASEKDDIGDTQNDSHGNLAPATVREVFQFADSTDIVLMIVGSICAVAHGVLFPINTVLFGNITNNFADFESVTPEEGQEVLDDVIFASKLFLILGTVAWFLSVVQVACWMISSQRQCKRIRTLYLRSILTQEISFYDVQDTGELTSQVAGDVDLIQAGIGDKLATLIMYTSTFVAGVIVGFVYGWKLTLVILAVVPAIIVTGAIFAKIVASATTEGQAAYARAGGVASEILCLIRTVAAFGGEADAVEKYNAELGHAYSAGVWRARMAGIGMGLDMFVFFCSYALGFWYGNKLVVNGELKPGDVITVFFAVVLGAMSIGQAAPAVKAFAIARGAAPRVFQVIHRKSRIDPFSMEGRIPSTMKGSLELKHVDFAYPTRPDFRVLKGMALRIEPGKTTALVGASGCGKSTAVQLIERFYDPSSGEIRLDGVDLGQYNLSWLRSQIGFVNQTPTLFAVSVKDNIALGAGSEALQDEHGVRFVRPRDVTMKEIMSAAKQANAHDFILELPDKYDTLIGERGATLSGGQKQRIAIARALVRNPRILLLDEATSALDSENERLVQDALNRAAENRTTIIIAHRLSTIRAADSIAVISDGEIVEIGRHDDLMQSDIGIYRALVNLQEIKGAEGKDEENGVEKGFESRADVAAVPSESFAVEEGGQGTALKAIDKGVILRAMKLNSPQWSLMLLGILGAIGVGSTWPLMGLVVAEVFNVLIDPNAPGHEIRNWSLVFLGLGLYAFAANYLQFGFLGQSGECLTTRLRSLSFKSMLRQEMAYFDDLDNSVGALTTRLSTEASLVKGVTGDLLGILVQVSSSITTGLVIAFTACWQVALAITAVVPLVALAGGVEVKVLVGFDTAGREKFAAAGRLASEAVDSIRTVQTLGLEQYFLDRYEKELLGPLKAGRRTAWVSGVAYGFSELMVFILWSVAFWYGSDLVRNDRCDFEGLMKAVMGLFFGAISLGQVSAFAPDVGAAVVAATKIFRLIDRKSELDPEDLSGAALADVAGGVHFSDVYFEYPTRPDVKVLRNFGFDAAPGKTVAIVGKSGCGKSTTVALLERFYNIRKGKIAIDDTDIKDVNLQSLRSNLSLVSQEPDLFDMSVRDNIAYGFSKVEGTIVTDDQIRTAAVMANAHGFVSELPQGYDTVVGERGGLLSGGQRQRIAIARALVRNPKILLLDEATSALDSESEHVVQHALEKASAGRTTLVIAHRLSTVQSADNILVIDRGRVVECGTHAELMALGKVYAELVRNQTTQDDS